MSSCFMTSENEQQIVTSMIVHNTEIETFAQNKIVQQFRPL